MTAQNGHISSDCLKELQSYLFDEEQANIIMYLARYFNSSNNITYNVRRVLTDDEMADAIRMIMKDPIFKKKKSGHFFAIYKLLTNPDNPVIDLSKTSDFHMWLNKILGTNRKYFSKSLFSYYLSSPLRYPYEEWRKRIKEEKFKSFIYIYDEFRKILEQKQ